MVKTIYYTDYKKKFFILISFVLIILLIFPYLSIRLIYILFIQIILLIKNKNAYTTRSNYSFKNTLSVLIYTLFITIFIDYSSVLKNIQLVSRLFILYQIKFIFLYNSSMLQLKLCLGYICIDIPKYIKHLIKINISYLVLMNSFSSLFKREIILKNFIKLLSLDDKIIFYKINKLNSLLSNQLLEKLLENITCVYVGAKIKNKISMTNFINQMLNSIYVYIEILSNVTYSYNITLWTKSINLKFYDKKFAITL